MVDSIAMILLSLSGGIEGFSVFNGKHRDDLQCVNDKEEPQLKNNGYDVRVRMRAGV